MNFKRPLLFFTDKDKRWLYLDAKGLYKNLPDEEYLKRRYYHTLGRELDLSNPRRFNEKIQWLKLNDRNEKYRKYVDKIEVKEIVGKLIGHEHIIPTISIYESFKDIVFSKLPQQYVMKCNHDSGTAYIHKGGEPDKRKIDRLKGRLKYDYYLNGREWPYKGIQRKILVEEVIGEGNEIDDYKVFVFHGKANFIQVDYNRFTDHHRNFYDMDWQYIGFTTKYPTDPNHSVDRPKDLEKVIDFSERIAGQLNNPAYVRVDFYIVHDFIYFGEVTFYHGSGFEQFYPDHYDYALGDLMGDLKE